MDKITEYLHELLIEPFFNTLRGVCLKNIETMFESVNLRVGTIATELGKNPQSWNSSIFNMIKNISDNVIIPIAGMILAAILVYEFLSLIIEKNNMHDVPIETFGKIFFKMGICIYLLSHTFDFVMAIFDVAQYVVTKASGIITGAGKLTVSGKIESELNSLTGWSGLFDLIFIALLTLILGWVMAGISVVIMIILYGRMIEIYMYTAIAPIPFATFGNKEWGGIGQNYIKAILALAFQAFLMMICVAIYAALVDVLNVSSNIQNSLIEMVGYTVLLVLSLFKTTRVSQSIFNAH